VRLVLATRNDHKLRELGPLLVPHELVPLTPGLELPPEVGETFRENALGKARAAVALTGSVGLGEDSGIQAVALGGAPGVRSARYAGEHAGDAENLAKLLREVSPQSDTRAAYACALAAIWPDGTEICVEGRCSGRLTHQPRGEGGFGYDPAFVPDDLPGGRTMAEISGEEKSSISHRGRAARALLDRLEAVERIEGT